MVADADALNASLEVWRRTLDVNLTGNFLTTRYALPEICAVAAEQSSTPCRPRPTAERPSVWPTAHPRLPLAL
jgi:NAD(P)-dependent dehydrogenase (short-subunit alcohol dehydrogenase family)